MGFLITGPSSDTLPTVNHESRNAQQTRLQANLTEAFFSIKSPSSEIGLRFGGQADQTKQNSHLVEKLKSLRAGDLLVPRMVLSIL